MALQTRSRNAIENGIKEYRHFQSASVSGQTGSPVTYGQLPVEWKESAKRADYVLYSYQTPIAWVVAGEWTIPPVKYSVTTTNHQGTVRYILAMLGKDVVAE